TLNLTSTTVGGTSFSWTGPNGFTSTLQNPTIPNATTAATGTYTVIVSNGSCTASASTSVTVNAAPVAGITNNSGTTVLTCTQTSISVTATGGSTYAWSGGLGNAANASITTAGT